MHEPLPLIAVITIDLKLDQLMGSQCNSKFTDHTIRYTLLADANDGFQLMSQALEVSFLVFGEHIRTLPVIGENTFASLERADEE